MVPPPPEDRVYAEMFQHRQEDRHEDHDDLGPFQRPAEDEDDRRNRIMNWTGVRFSDSTRLMYESRK